MAIFYLPPAAFDGDFAASRNPDALRQNWDNYIGGRIADRDENLFYDAKHDPAPEIGVDRVPIPWNGFPRSISAWFNADSDADGLDAALKTSEILRPLTIVITPRGARTVSWRPGLPLLRAVRNGAAAEEIVPLHRQQDEYCEWHVDRDAKGIQRISFTAEGPEYWREIARFDRDLLLASYKRLISAEVVMEDLFWQHPVAAQDQSNNFHLVIRKGDYNPYNKWNTTHGVMHLTHPANTLGAEINLAADATVIYPSVAEQPADTLPTRLICCAQYGGENRSSDPLIGNGVNGAARKGLPVTLANPVGLYIGTIDIDNLLDPDGNPIGDQVLSTPRKSADGEMILRAEIKAPDNATFTLDQCTLGGRELTTGGVIARKITMRLFGLVKKKTVPSRQPASEACASKCCSKPTARNFRMTVALATECAKLKDEDFKLDAPWTEHDQVPGAGGLKELVGNVAGKVLASIEPTKTVDLDEELPPTEALRNPLKGLR
ncbi:MAG TPA: hypothetical protein VGF48_15970 [Thermoanaerobaculia bacterium]|jgi:hypothetical protein